jgi:hypothetical protein
MTDRIMMKQTLLFVAVTMMLVACSADRVEGQLLTSSEFEEVNQYAAIKKYAIVIGINDYSGKFIPDLKYAVTDAEALYNVLIDPRQGGFLKENVFLLTDSSDNPPSAANIGKTLKRMISQVDEDDLALVFFSGHGYEEEGRAYLLPNDADIDALDYTAIERDAFVRQVDKLKAKKVIVIMDACHSGGISRGGKGVGSDAALSNRYYDTFLGSQGRAFIASCSGGQLSWEDEQFGHGVFTNSLVRGLSGEADTSPQDGLVTLFELRRFLEEEVSDWAERHGKTQQPQVSLEAAYGDMPLSINMNYVEDRTKVIEARKKKSERLKVGLVGVEGLSSEELAYSVTVLGKMATGASMTQEEEQTVLFIERLVEGSIDLSMYRLGVRGIVAVEDSSEPASLLKSRTWYISGFAGASTVIGDEFVDGFKFSPAAQVGYSWGRFDLAINYINIPGSLVEDQYLEDFSANLLTVGAKVQFQMAKSLLASLQIGIGGYFGSEIRDDRVNTAVNAGIGLDLYLTTNISVGLLASWIYSNAALISPSEQELGSCIFAGVGISYSGRK